MKSLLSKKSNINSLKLITKFLNYYNNKVKHLYPIPPVSVAIAAPGIGLPIACGGLGTTTSSTGTGKTGGGGRVNIGNNGFDVVGLCTFMLGIKPRSSAVYVTSISLK